MSDERPRVSPERLHAFLGDPRSYAGQSKRVRMLQTHSAWLSLVGRRVFKVKKPVNFGFLDFSTLEKRRYFCEREVVLNRRLCPGTHLGVVPISMHKGRLSFGDRGEIVEYAIEMRRLPERGFLLPLLARGRVGTREVDAIVDTLVPFYRAHEPTPEIEQWGSIANLRISTDENFRQTEDFVGVTISRPALAAIRHWTAAFFRQNSALFAARIRDRRIRDRRIRDCHGDLHLEHIHLSRKGITIYD